MAAKAVYQSLVLAVYVTRDELEQIVAGRTISVPLFVGQDLLLKSGALLSLTPPGFSVVYPLYVTDRAIYDSVPRKPSGQIKDSHYKKRRVSEHGESD